MPLTAKALREKRKPLAVEIRRQADLVSAAGRDFTAEERTAWDAVNADYNLLSTQIVTAERVESVEHDQSILLGDPRLGRTNFETTIVDGAGHDGAQHAVSEEQRSLAFQAWVLVQSKKPHKLTEDHMKALAATRLNASTSELALPLYSTQDFRRLQRQVRRAGPKGYDEVHDFKATMSDKSGPGGAYLIPPETLVRELEINLLYYGGMREVADSIRTTTGERISWPTGDDTTNTGVQLEESTTIGNSVDPGFAKVFWDAYKFSSKPILVPYELMQDSAFNLIAMLGEMLGIRLGRITNTKFTVGTGANTPKGLTVATATGVTTASATAIAWDEVINLIYSVDKAYRRPGCGFMMHDLVVGYLRKLKDGMGRPIWTSGWNVGEPDTIQNYPLTVNNDMASTVAANNITALFGDFSHYKIRTVGEVRMYHLQERYRDTDQDAFIAFMREDGNLLTAGTTPVKALLQHA